MNVIHHDAAVAAAALIVNTLQEAPPGGTAEVFGRIAFIVRHAIERALELERKQRDATVLCLGCFRSLLLPLSPCGSPIRCPACDCEQGLPQAVGTN